MTRYNVTVQDTYLTEYTVNASPMKYSGRLFLFSRPVFVPPLRREMRNAANVV